MKTVKRIADAILTGLCYVFESFMNALIWM